MSVKHKCFRCLRVVFTRMREAPRREPWDAYF